MTPGKTAHNNEEVYAAAHAIDRDHSTIAATRTDDGAGWLKIQFGKTYFINKIIIYSRFFNDWYQSNDWCIQSESNYKACVDNENNVDVSVYQGEVKQKSCGTLQLTYGLDQSDQIYTLICNVHGDNVKLSKSNDEIAVFEVVVIGTGKLISTIIS